MSHNNGCLLLCCAAPQAFKKIGGANLNIPDYKEYLELGAWLPIERQRVLNNQARHDIFLHIIV